MVNGENSLYTDKDDHVELKILKYLQSHQLDICIKIVFNIYANGSLSGQMESSQYLVIVGFYRFQTV